MEIIDNLIQDLGLSSYVLDQEEIADGYLLNLGSDYNFGRVYSILDRSSSIDSLDDYMQLTLEGSSLYYVYNDELYLNLIADFDNDSYQLLVQNQP